MDMMQLVESTVSNNPIEQLWHQAYVQARDWSVVESILTVVWLSIVIDGSLPKKLTFGVLHLVHASTTKFINSWLSLWCILSVSVVAFIFNIPSMVVILVDTSSCIGECLSRTTATLAPSLPLDVNEEDATRGSLLNWYWIRPRRASFNFGVSQLLRQKLCTYEALIISFFNLVGFLAPWGVLWFCLYFDKSGIGKPKRETRPSVVAAKVVIL